MYRSKDDVEHHRADQPGDVWRYGHEHGGGKHRDEEPRQPSPSFHGAVQLAASWTVIMPDLLSPYPLNPGT